MVVELLWGWSCCGGEVVVVVGTITLNVRNNLKN